LVGNHGAQRAIQRQQRERAATGAPPATAAGPGRYLSDERRTVLRLQTTLRLSTAYTDYALACEEVKREIREEIEENTEFAMAVVSIFLGVIGPAVARAFHSYLDRIPITASSTVTRAGLLAINHEEQIQTFASENAPKVAERLVGAAAAGGEDADNAVIGALRTGFRGTIDEIAGNFDRMTDTRLIAIWANYDPAIATQEHFRAEIRRAVEVARAQARAERERRRREEQARREEHNREVRERGAQTGDYIYTPRGSRVQY
jgi:hypothetical protein